MYVNCPPYRRSSAQIGSSIGHLSVLAPGPFFPPERPLIIGWHLGYHPSMEMFMDRNMSFTRGLRFSWNDDEPLVIMSPLVSQGAVFFLFVFFLFQAWCFHVFPSALMAFSSWSTEDYIFKYASKMRKKLLDYRSLVEGMCLSDISGKRWHGDVGWQSCWTVTHKTLYDKSIYIYIYTMCALQ